MEDDGRNKNDIYKAFWGEKMGAIIFISILCLAFLSWGIVCIVNPKLGWKRGFMTSLKVKEPNEGQILNTRIAGVIYIIFSIVFLIGFIIKSQ
jgi:hypothetical protein